MRVYLVNHLNGVLTILIVVQETFFQNTHGFDGCSDDFEGPKQTENVCTTEECKYTAKQILSKLKMDENPCENFYEFVCGRMLEPTIDNGTNNLTEFQQIRYVMGDRLISIMSETPKEQDPRSLLLLKEMYMSCMESKNEIKSLAEMIKRLGGWPTIDKNWNEDCFSLDISAKLLWKNGHGLYDFFNLMILPDAKNTSYNRINILMGNLEQKMITAQPDPLNVYSPQQTQVSEAVMQTAFHIVKYVSIQLGADPFQATYDLEETKTIHNMLQLAGEILGTDYTDPNASYNLMTIKEMEEQFGNIPWFKIFSAIFESDKITYNMKINVVDKRYLKYLDGLLSTTSKRAIANYIMTGVVLRSLQYLNEEYRQFVYSPMADFQDLRSKIEQCSAVIMGYFGDVLEYEYIKRYFDDNIIESVTSMVHNLHKELEVSINENNWLVGDSKQTACMKGAYMNFKIGYKNKSLYLEQNEFYSKLAIDPNKYFDSIYKMRKIFMEKFARLNTPFSVVWQVTAVMAYYVSILNTVYIGAGILQGMFFLKRRPQYLNYGSLGFVIGHEITHGFGTVGKNYDEHTNINNWFNPTTELLHSEIIECFISQAQDPSKAAVTLEEDMADNGGVKLAYNAYKKWSRSRPRDAELKLPGLEQFSANQLFWMSVANPFCDSKESASMYKEVHSSSEARINRIASNNYDFAKDYMCPLGSAMNPKKKCVVWK